MFLQVFFFFWGGGLKWDSLKKQTNKKRVPVLLFPSIARFQPELTPVFFTWFYLVLPKMSTCSTVFQGVHLKPPFLRTLTVGFLVVIFGSIRLY